MQSQPLQQDTQQQQQGGIIKMSIKAQEKAEAARLYIERKYSKLKVESQQRAQNWDAINSKLKSMNLNDSQTQHITDEIRTQEAELLRKQRQKITTKDFEPLRIIGKGAFGEVRICKCKLSGEIVAVKKMKKTEMLLKNQVGHVISERNVLAEANIPWIVDLKYSFQDKKYLYLVMEFVAGGDLMTLLMEKDILSELEARFYIAETILAVEAVHKMKCIHRDLKPDNILMTAEGHIKLSDFGLCKEAVISSNLPTLDITGGAIIDDSTDTENVLTNLHEINKSKFTRNRQKLFSVVGTPDYIAPEIFSGNGYTETVDWWSVGVILYEMLVGYPPFYSDDPSTTCKKIINWKKTLVIPEESQLSPAASDLIKKLLNDAKQRLGINGVGEIKSHPFFKGINWETLRGQTPPYVPEMKGDIGSRFDEHNEVEPWEYDENNGDAGNNNLQGQQQDLMQEKQQQGNEQHKERKDMNFIGYTYKKGEERVLLVKALQKLDSVKQEIDAMVSATRAKQQAEQLQQQQQLLELQQQQQKQQQQQQMQLQQQQLQQQQQQSKIIQQQQLQLLDSRGLEQSNNNNNNNKNIPAYIPLLHSPPSPSQKEQYFAQQQSQQAQQNKEELLHQQYQQQQSQQSLHPYLSTQQLQYYQQQQHVQQLSQRLQSQNDDIQFMHSINNRLVQINSNNNNSNSNYTQGQAEITAWEGQQQQNSQIQNKPQSPMMNKYIPVTNTTTTQNNYSPYNDDLQSSNIIDTCDLDRLSYNNQSTHSNIISQMKQTQNNTNYSNNAALIRRGVYNNLNSSNPNNNIQHSSRSNPPVPHSHHNLLPKHIEFNCYSKNNNNNNNSYNNLNNSGSNGRNQQFTQCLNAAGRGLNDLNNQVIEGTNNNGGNLTGNLQSQRNQCYSLERTGNVDMEQGQFAQVVDDNIAQQVLEQEPAITLALGGNNNNNNIRSGLPNNISSVYSAREYQQQQQQVYSNNLIVGQQQHNLPSTRLNTDSQISQQPNNSRLFAEKTQFFNNAQTNKSTLTSNAMKQSGNIKDQGEFFGTQKYQYQQQQYTNPPQGYSAVNLNNSNNNNNNYNGFLGSSSQLQLTQQTQIQLQQQQQLQQDQQIIPPILTKRQNIYTNKLIQEQPVNKSPRGLFSQRDRDQKDKIKQNYPAGNAAISSSIPGNVPKGVSSLLQQQLIGGAGVSNQIIATNRVDYTGDSTAMAGQIGVGSYTFQQQLLQKVLLQKKNSKKF